MKTLVLLLLSAVAALVRADPAGDRLQAQRVEADATLAAKERECAGRFVVSGCVDAARSEHRDVLAQLRQKALLIDDAQRRAVETARSKAIADKAAAQASRPGENEPEAPRVRTRREPRRETRDEEIGGRAVPTPQAKSPALPPNSARSTLEQRSLDQDEARQRAAQAHREAVEERNAARRARGKSVAPLLLPGGASAAR